MQLLKRDHTHAHIRTPNMQISNDEQVYSKTVQVQPLHICNFVQNGCGNLSCALTCELLRLLYNKGRIISH